jgi:hypothetical protein
MRNRYWVSPVRDVRSIGDVSSSRRSFQRWAKCCDKDKRGAIWRACVDSCA